MAKLTNNDNDNETIEIATDEDVYVPIASTDALGVASFNSEDFTVAQDGKVSLINKVAGIQFLGTITAASDSMLTWKISEYSDGDIEAPVAGDKIMLLESIAFNYDEDTSSYVVNEDSVTTGDLVFIGGGIYVLTSVQAYDTSTLEPVYTNTEYISLLKGGADGVDGIDGTDGADANVKVGTVTTNTVYSTTANVSVTGTTSNHITTLDFTFDVPNVGEKGEDGADGKDGADGSDGKDGTDGTDGVPAYAGKVGVLGYDVESVNFTDVTWINYTPTTDLECVIYLSEYSDDTKETIVTELCVGKVLYEVGLVMISDKVVISGADAADIDTSLFVTKTEFPEAVAGLIESDITERIDQGTLIGENEYNELLAQNVDDGVVIGENEYNDLIAGTSILELSDASLTGTILTLAHIEMTNALDLHYGYELSTDKTQISYVMSVNNNYTESIPLSIATDKTNYQVQLTVGNGTDAAVISAAVPKVSFASSSTGGGIKISDSFNVDTTLYPVVNSTGGITFATSYSEDQNVLSKATSIFGKYALSSTVTTNYDTLNNKFSDYVAVDNLYTYFTITGDILYVNSNKIGAVTVDMSDYVDNDTFDTKITEFNNSLSKYLLIDTASNTYATQTTVTNNYNTLNNKFNDYLLASALDAYTKTDDLASIIADKVEEYNYTTLAAVADVGYLTAIPTLYASVASNGAITISTTAGTGTTYNYISNYVSPFDISAYKIIVDSNNALVLSNSSTATAVTTSSLASLLDSNFMTSAEVTSAIEAYKYVTSSDVTSAITSYGYTTLTEVAKQGYLTKSIFGTYDSLAEYLSGNNYVTEAVQSVSTGTTDGTVIVKTSSGTNTTVAVAGLGDAAYTNASAYATAAQGSLADTAVQSVSTGTSNGTILVDGSSVSVQGLGSAAYTASTAYAAASVADTVSSLSGTVSTLSTKVSTLESADSGSTVSLDMNSYSDGMVLTIDGVKTVVYPYVYSTGRIGLTTYNNSGTQNYLSNAISVSGTTLSLFGTDYSISGGSGVTSVSATFDNNVNSSTAGQITINIDDLTTSVNINDFVDTKASSTVGSILYDESSTGFVNGYLSNYFVKGNDTIFNATNISYGMEIYQNSTYLYGYFIGDNGQTGFLNSKMVNTSEEICTDGVGYMREGVDVQSPTTSITYPNGMQVSTIIMAANDWTIPHIDDLGYVDINNVLIESDYNTEVSYIEFSNDYNGGVCTLYGTWTASSDIEITSDENLKNTIEDLSDKYEVLFDNLRPVSFKYNNGSSSRLHTGFIAQDVVSALTTAELTTQDFAAVCKNSKTERYSIRYGELVALCVQKIQRLDARVKVLEAANSDFESRIAALEAKLSE